MSSRAEALLQDLSQSIGLPDLKFDEQNMCTLLVDGEHRITLLANSETHLILYGILGGWPDDAPSNFGLDLLTANMLLAELEGPHLGYEPLSKSVLLVKSCPLDGLDVERLEAQMDEMINHQENSLRFILDKGVHLKALD